MDQKQRCYYCNKYNDDFISNNCCHSPLDFIYTINNIYNCKPSILDDFIRSSPVLLIFDSILFVSPEKYIEDIPIEFCKIKNIVINELITNKY